ncbi:MAG TPA: hypothetical protein VK063_00150 [Beutenbergiaceae bacterium]|nr:hypothetical protein [Beutenbergiaceae bacterium]
MTVATQDSQPTAPQRRAQILLFSDDYTTREKVRTAIGRRASVDTPLIEWTEVATPEATELYVHERYFDLLVLDGESPKHGGMGLCRTLKSEVFNCPPVLLLIARAEDAWLASWSEADSVVGYPLDPFVVQEAVAEILRERVGNFARQ